MSEEQQSTTGAAPAPSISDLIAQRVSALAQSNETLQRQIGDLARERQVSQVETQMLTLQQSTEKAATDAQSALEAAIESGDARSQAVAYAKLAEATSEKQRVAAEIRSYRAQQERERNAPPPPPKVDTSELDKFRARNQTWYGRDQEMTTTALQIAAQLEAGGVTKGSPEYFAGVERVIKERFPDRMGGVQTPPTAGGGAGGGGGGGNAAVRVPKELIDSWMAMGALDDPNDVKQIQELMGYRKQAVDKGILPAKAPADLSLGRLNIRRA